jgi:putative addiction module killer protein
MREAIARQVDVYVDAAGRAPFSDWLRNLRDGAGRARIRARINRLRLGNFGDCKPVGEGVNELRVDYGPGYRVYFAEAGRRVVLLLCGGDKRTQVQDIERARVLWSDFRSRGNGEE